MSDFQVLCVKIGNNEGTRPLIEEAYKCLQDEKMSPSWCTEDKCLQVKEKKKGVIFIFELFEGAAYKHVASLGSRVFGPMCIITCLACKQNIPRKYRPIYNLAMKDILVCCSNIDKAERTMIQERVELMGGEYTKDLTEGVTHLVVGAVGGSKYLVAGSRSIQIMLPQWIENVWQKSQLRAAHGLDEQFQQDECPIFKGCVITVSGLHTTARNEAKRLIEKEGGVYSGEMKAKECTHLIINEAKGQKYQFAKKWELSIVRTEWLYDSIERGYCLSPQDYGLEDGGPAGMKTSTPERQSMTGAINDISNISMISMANVNETANSTSMMTRLDNNAVTRLDDPTDDLDLTKTPADMFLDGCKIYLSGFRGASLERLRKIINAGGGTRFNQITENLTHMVVGELIASDIEQVKSLLNRPHVVSSKWLVECYKQESHVTEAAYLSAHVPSVQPKTPDSKLLKRKSSVQTNKDQGPSSAQTRPPTETGEDMQDIMSQYLNNPADGTVEDNDETMAPAVAAPVDPHDLTQDPDATAGIGDKIFAGKTFVLYGFDEEGIPALTAYIKEGGGVVLQTSDRHIPDYAIVPMDGFPVDRTVNNIVTNTWMQMCMEQNALLDVDSNPLFTPIEINMEGAPLKDCVLSISGYSGTERDILISIAEVLGATCQDYFVRTAKNNLLPSTHLVVNAAEGSKYEAAKKWGIPALSKLWILSCARQGKKVPEDKYLIEIVSNDNLMSQVPTVENQNGSVLENRSGRVSVREANPSEIGQQNIVDSKEADGAHVNKSNGKITDAESNSGGTNKVAERKGEKNIGAKLKQGNNEKVSAVGDHGFSQTDGDFMENNDSDAMLLQLESQENYQPVIPVVETELKTTAKDREVKPASTSVANNRDINVNDVPRNTDIAEAPVVNTKDGKALNKNLLPATKHVAPAETPPFERLKRRWDKNPPLTGTPVLTKQSAKDKLKEMPARKHNWRYDDWVAKNDWTAKNGSSQKENLGLATSTPVQSRVKELKRQDGKKVDIDTPSKFLNPNVRYIPKFETEEFLASLQTPEDVRAARAKRKPSLNDSELFELMRAKMEVTIEQRRQERESAVASSQRQNDEVDGDYEDVPTALQGVVITVARRLAKDQAEFNEIVTCLGGEYRWTIDNTCTHFIFQGRQNDTTKDFKQAKAQGLKIVSPHWLYMCKEQNARVDESLFPHTFNPNLSLAVVTTRGTPMRTPRVRRNIKSVTEPPKSAVTAKNEAEKTSPSVDRNSEGGNSGSGTPARKGGKSPVANLVCKLTGSLDKSPSEEDKQQPQETVGSLEMREVLSKQLEDVMAQNTGKRRRRGSKRLNCSGQVGTPEDSSASSGAKSRRTEEKVAVVERNSAENQPSQSVHVVWDDPIRRSEQEKLAHQLARANSPTQDVPDDFHEQAAQFSETDDDDEEPKLPVFQAHVQAEEAQTPKQPKSTTGKTPTPDPPSIAFPVGKAPKVTPPQPIVLDDDNDDDEEEVTFKRPPPVFIMSGIEAAERDTYGALVEHLGGRVIDAQQFDIACTHLVIDKITRNEKFLACLASGKWILHKSYFNACREEGQFVKEDFFEWGGEGTLALVKNMDNSVRLLAAAAREWRIKLSQQRQVSSTKFGAFSTWRVILICEKGKVSNFIRLLTAGGATVLNMRPPFPARVDATHVLMEPHKIPVPQEDLEKLLSSGCLCLKPEYISGYLCNPESDVAAFTPPEIQALLAAMSGNDSGSKKRKCSTGEESQKRTKRR